MSDNMGDVADITQDFAIEAWHEDGRWSVAALPDPDDLLQIVDRLKKQQTNGGAVALISIDDEFFLAIRVLGTQVKFFISDISCALDYEIAAEFLELADIDSPEEEDEPLPAGDLDIFADLGLAAMELSTICDDADLFPDEQIDAVASRLGFGEQLTELLES
jgi:putative tRNA adenosine deaminase-associated protein|uniref:tRNA adenosine deaminase-associated protein n=1 Tax=Candidatus Planktophila sp. TaxID=2175601 RepID=UPI00404AFB77